MKTNSQAIIDDIEFPALIFNDGYVGTSWSKGGYTSCTAIGFKRSKLPGQLVVDSRGASCRVLSAKRGRVTKPWWREPLFFSRYYEIEYELQREKSLSLEEVRDLLLKGLAKNFSKSRSKNRRLEKVRTETDSCTTIKELITYVHSTACWLP